ncbi:MAG: amino acid ABC transporter substrate-binding protein [Deltaproteobacteria bacterium]|nr:amino acid ABC transporter substrate-binding protein [Deltaproteobacteria bacterium]PWB60579.1 MAG: amino acid ABC transporter substrate-binding protein [Deltaproteobacteria bacterium]
MKTRSLALAGFVLVVFLAASAQAADTIKVGLVDTYTGPATAFTNDVLDGFKLAVEKINAKGGVLGRKIAYITRDDKFKPDIGLTMAKELILKENVDLLMGTINSATALAVSDLCRKEKVPFLVTFSKSDKITGEKGHRYVFSMNENTEMAGRATARVLAKKPFVKYWIAGDDYEYGHAIANGVFDHLKKLNPKAQLLGQSWWKVGETDFTPYITQILAAKPDFVIVATGGAGMVNFQKAAQSTGFNKRVPFYQHTGIELSTLAPQGQNAPEGVYGTANYLFYYPNTKQNQAFADEFRKAYNRYPKSGALYGYMAAQFIAKSYEKAGKVDKEKFIDALEGMSLDSPVGRMEMRACDHQVALPMFFGVTKKSPKQEFLVASDILSIPGKDYMPTCEEIRKARAK